jgi:hypothetical protein
MVTTTRTLTAAIVVAVAVWSGVHITRAQTPTTPSTPPAQDDAAKADAVAELELTRASVQVARQAYVTSAMDLEAKEAEAFWPLYREYRDAMGKVNDRTAKLLVDYLTTYDNLSDEAAKRMLNDFLSIEKARTGVKTQYVPRFSKVLPPRKVARFFQVDNKLDAVIAADLARSVPLAR